MSSELMRLTNDRHLNRVRVPLVTVLSIIAVCCSSPAAETDKAPAKIGVYDSRAIAVAFAGSKIHEEQLRMVADKSKAAKAAGDTAQVKEFEDQMRQQQKELHRQGFSTAPVDKLLALVKDEVARVMKEKEVPMLVSKWDKDTLAKYPDAKQVDVTMALADAFHPNERQRKNAVEVQKHKPVPLDELEKHLEKEGH
ncbi:MAG: hypothetical protein IT364_11785 [Candidatus Hydrogenedentes bacterium]|nr:hypothetical protein [Candidatus Hydrogenedentota bacterium]